MKGVFHTPVLVAGKAVTSINNIPTCTNNNTVNC